MKSFARTREAKSEELRLIFRSSAKPGEGSAEAANAAIRANQPWLYGEIESQEATIEDTRVAWYRVFGNLGTDGKT